MINQKSLSLFASILPVSSGAYDVHKYMWIFEFMWTTHDVVK